MSGVLFARHHGTYLPDFRALATSAPKVFEGPGESGPLVTNREDLTDCEAMSRPKASPQTALSVVDLPRGYLVKRGSSGC